MGGVDPTLGMLASLWVSLSAWRAASSALLVALALAPSLTLTCLFTTASASATQPNLAQHSTAQHSTTTDVRENIQHSTAQHSTAQHSTAQPLILRENKEVMRNDAEE